MLSAEIDDGSGRLALRLFHFYPSQVRQLAAGQRVRAYGTLRSGLFGPEITHPTLRPAGPLRPPGPRPPTRPRPPSPPRPRCGARLIPRNVPQTDPAGRPVYI
ncbi:MAG: OB-fold nucleic acid binding domain-containing protein, partial [bacterium]